jgi:uncharacterized protein YkwD
MGSSASVTAHKLSNDNVSKEEIINLLLPHFIEEPTKCAEIYNILTEKAKIEKKKKIQEAHATKKDVALEPLQGTKSFSEEISMTLNKLRLDPQSFIPIAEAHLASFVDDLHFKDKLGRENLRIRTREGKAAVLDCIEYLKTVEPLPPISANLFLEKAAFEHVEDLSTNNQLSHTGTDGSTTQERIEKHVHWRGSIGEAIDCGNVDAENIILSLLIDDGTPSRGHRSSILNPEFLVVGAALGNHPTYSYCCVMDFAATAIDWEQIQRQDVIVTSDSSIKNANGEVEMSQTFKKVLRSIPVDSITEDVEDMLLVPDTHVTIDFKATACSAVISRKCGKSTRQISLQWGANKA